MKKRFDRWAARWDSRPSVAVCLLVFSYIAMVVFPIQRRLWHDELYTYYIAGAPNLRILFTEIRRMDLNPPLIYLLTRGWQSIFGVGEMMSRVPSVIAFLLAALGFYAFLLRRMGSLWAAAPLLLFWCTPYFQYATELRPYALLLFFFSVTLNAWDFAIGCRWRTAALAGILLGATGMMLCHVVAIFSLGAIYLSEMVRQFRARHLDWAIWGCLLAPLSFLLIYIPLLHTFDVILYPPIFQAGPRKIAVFFAKAVLGLALPFGLATLAAVLVSPFDWSRLRNIAGRISKQDLYLSAGLLATPFILNVLMARNHGAFFERYAITCALLISVSAVLVLGQLTAFSPSTAVALLIVFVSVGLWSNTYKGFLGSKQQSVRIDLVKPELNFVVANGTTFLEIDHYENSNFLSRVYYLTDRDDAIKFANATNFERVVLLEGYFPLRANITPYQDFVRHHSHFLVLGDIQFAEEWLLRKLRYDGAAITPLSGALMKYNGAILYDVQLP